MFQHLDVFQMSSAMARHAAQSQALTAQNVANADTPHFVGKEMPPFAALYTPAENAAIQRATREGHLNGTTGGPEMAPVEMRGSEKPNGNTISLEIELLKAADASSHHERALAIYKSSMDVLRATIRK